MDETKVILDAVGKVESQVKELRKDIKDDMSKHDGDQNIVIKDIWSNIDEIKVVSNKRELDQNIKIAVLENERQNAKDMKKMVIGAFITGGISFVFSVGLIIVTLIF